MHQTGDPQLTNQLYRDRHLDVRSYFKWSFLLTYLHTIDIEPARLKKKSAGLFTLQMISTVLDRTFYSIYTLKVECI